MKHYIFIAVTATMILGGCASKKGAERDLTRPNETAQTQQPVADDVSRNINETKVIDNTSIGEKTKIADETTKQSLADEIKTIYFGYNLHTLDEEMKTRTLDNYKYLEKQNLTTLKLGAHTDEWGSDEYNYALGLKRAKGVKDAMSSYGFNKEMIIVSYGETNPTCTEHTEECWAKNRRVEYELNR